MIEMSTMTKNPVNKHQIVRRWDFLSSLKPPAGISIDSGKIFSTVTLAPGQPDYDFVSNKFTSTFFGHRGIKKSKNQIYPGMIPNFGLANNFGNGGGFNMAGVPLMGGAY
jgi:hypothetical protein